MTCIRFLSLMGLGSLALVGGGCGADDSSSGQEEAADATPGPTQPVGTMPGPTQPMDAIFFDGLWESHSVGEGLPCDGEPETFDLSAQPVEYFYFTSDPNAEGVPTSYNTHFCYRDTDCSAAPALGYRFTLVDGEWKNALSVGTTPEAGDICTAVGAQHHVVGEEFYWVRTEYEAPGRLAVASGECLGPADGEEWVCRSREISLYQRSDEVPTLD